MLKELIGVLICLGGLVLGLYLGVWVCFIGGIVQVIEAIKAVPVDAMGIALGILRFFSASLVGWASGLVVFGCGQQILKS